jgi:hypothetical protein
MFGDNLSGFKIQYLVGESAEDLRDQFTQIKIPYRIISIYGSGSRHYAWINTTMAIKIKKKNKQELRNGSIEG